MQRNNAEHTSLHIAICYRVRHFVPCKHAPAEYPSRLTRRHTSIVTPVREMRGSYSSIAEFDYCYEATPWCWMSSFRNFPRAFELSTSGGSSFKERLCLLTINRLNPELNPICYLLALLAHHFLHVSRIRVKLLTLRLLMSYTYIYIYIYMERLFLMFLDHTQRRTTVGRTPLDE